MPDIVVIDQNHDLLRFKYIRYSKIFLFISLLLVLWFIIDFMGIIAFEFGPNWALLSFEHWLYVGCVIFLFFIVLELIFLLSYKAKISAQSKPKEEYYRGKKVFTYTYPKGSKGGVYSKTYIDIDDNTILRLRTQMISADELL